MSLDRSILSILDNKTTGLFRSSKGAGVCYGRRSLRAVSGYNIIFLIESFQQSYRQPCLELCCQKMRPNFVHKPLLAGDVPESSGSIQRPEPCKINVEMAAGLIVDSFAGIRRRMVRRNEFSIGCMKMHFRWLWLLRILSVLLMFLSFTEQPLWCANPDTVQCTDPYYPNSQIPYVDKTTGLIFEAVVIGLVTFDVLLKIGAYGNGFILYKEGPAGHEKYGVDGMNLVQSILVIAYLVDLSYAFVTTEFRFRLATFLRLCLVFFFIPEMRNEERVVAVIIPKFLKTMFMVFLLLLLYAFFGVVLFEDEEEGQQYFPDLWEGMWSLMILITTANYPDVMMPAYSKSRISSFFFVSFLLLGLFFLLNLLLAQVYSSYQEEKDMMFHQECEYRHESLQKAFEIMTEDQKNIPLAERNLTFQDIKAIFNELNQTHRGVHHISEEEANQKFAKLDEDQSNEIDLGEFYQFGVILEETFVVEDKISFMELWFPKTYSSQWFQLLKKGVESTMFEYFIDLCLVLNGALVVYQVKDQLEGNYDPSLSDGQLDTWSEAGETLFCLIYFVEMMLKIWVMGVHGYTRNYKNIFDGIVTIMGVSAAAYVYYPNSYSDPRIIRYVVFTRILRLVRLVTSLKMFLEIGETFVAILPAAKRLLISLFCVMYFFSWLGMELYGGKINTDPESPYSAKLANTDYDQDNYYANNFNDLGAGMITLFELLVVNNWFVIVDGFVAVTSEWSRLFFIFWYAIGVLIRLNIVVAFILDNYTQFEEERMKAHHEQEQEKLTGMSSDRRGSYFGDFNSESGDATEVNNGYLQNPEPSGSSPLSPYELRQMRLSNTSKNGGRLGQPSSLTRADSMGEGGMTPYERRQRRLSSLAAGQSGRLRSSIDTFLGPQFNRRVSERMLNLASDLVPPGANTNPAGEQKAEGKSKKVPVLNY